MIARVDGGETTNPLWTSEVDGAAFQGALRASLEQNDLLAKTAPSSRFDLFATLGSLNQPFFKNRLSNEKPQPDLDSRNGVPCSV